MDDVRSDWSVLCADRVALMTQTYHDVEAVTKLLDEKEKDLELAAKIGKSLLERNKQLLERNEALETQMQFANDQITQLRHDLQMKANLLHAYADDACSDGTSGVSTPIVDVNVINGLKEKVTTMELENRQLKQEAMQLKGLNDDFEEKEQHLMTDCLQQLNRANAQVNQLSQELAERSEECSSQRQEITHLLSQLVSQQSELKKVTLDCDETHQRYMAAQDAQYELSQELLDLQDRYTEVLAMLGEAQREVHRLTELNASLKNNCDSMYDSLQSELEASDSGFASSLLSARSSQLHSTPMSSAGRSMLKEPIMSTVPESPERRSQRSARSVSPDTVRVLTQPANIIIPPLANLTRSPSLDSIASSIPSPPHPGVPGKPGSRDLEHALKRLSLRRHADRYCRDYHAMLTGRQSALRSSRVATPRGPIPPAVPSFSSSIPFREITEEPCSSSAPETPKRGTATAGPKVMRFKAFEGSHTLSQWASLAAAPSITRSLLVPTNGIGRPRGIFAKASVMKATNQGSTTGAIATVAGTSSTRPLAPVGCPRSHSSSPDYYTARTGMTPRVTCAIDTMTTSCASRPTPHLMTGTPVQSAAAAMVTSVTGRPLANTSTISGSQRSLHVDVQNLASVSALSSKTATACEGLPDGSQVTEGSKTNLLTANVLPLPCVAPRSPSLNRATRQVPSPIPFVPLAAAPSANTYSYVSAGAANNNILPATLSLPPKSSLLSKDLSATTDDGSSVFDPVDHPERSQDAGLVAFLGSTCRSLLQPLMPADDAFSTTSDDTLRSSLPGSSARSDDVSAPASDRQDVGLQSLLSPRAEGETRSTSSGSSRVITRSDLASSFSAPASDRQDVGLQSLLSPRAEGETRSTSSGSSRVITRSDLASSFSAPASDRQDVGLQSLLSPRAEGETRSTSSGSSRVMTRSDLASSFSAPASDRQDVGLQSLLSPRAEGETRSTSSGSSRVITRSDLASSFSAPASDRQDVGLQSLLSPRAEGETRSTSSGSSRVMTRSDLASSFSAPASDRQDVGLQSLLSPRAEGETRSTSSGSSRVITRSDLASSFSAPASDRQDVGLQSLLSPRAEGETRSTSSGSSRVMTRSDLASSFSAPASDRQDVGLQSLLSPRAEGETRSTSSGSSRVMTRSDLASSFSAPASDRQDVGLQSLLSPRAEGETRSTSSGPSRVMTRSDLASSFSAPASDRQDVGLQSLLSPRAEGETRSTSSGSSRVITRSDLASSFSAPASDRQDVGLQSLLSPRAEGETLSTSSGSSRVITRSDLASSFSAPASDRQDVGPQSLLSPRAEGETRSTSSGSSRVITRSDLASSFSAPASDRQDVGLQSLLSPRAELETRSTSSGSSRVITRSDLASSFSAPASDRQDVGLQSLLSPRAEGETRSTSSGSSRVITRSDLATMNQSPRG